MATFGLYSAICYGLKTLSAVAIYSVVSWHAPGQARIAAQQAEQQPAADDPMEESGQ